MFRVLLAEPARRFYEDADATLQRKLDRCFEILKEDPRRHPNIKALRNRLKGYYRYRIGDYRVIYRIEDDGQLVIVAMIRHRSEAY